MSGFALAVHGGAGSIRREQLAAADAQSARDALREALEAGSAILAGGGSALDAVERAVRVLEANPLFNAGRGSVLNSAGRVAMDASVMDGRSRAAGAVAGLERTAHPVSAARMVMERSEHVLLVGAHADAFAAECGVEGIDPAALVTPERVAQLRRAAEQARVSLDHDEATRGTVGAVARDAHGHLAAATSTGGMTNQRPGRVGDSPLIGAGTWADDRSCAVSGTGHGEAFIRSAFAHEVDAGLRLGAQSLERACAAALARVGELGSTGGCIAVHRAGHLALPFTTTGMYRGWVRAGESAAVAIWDEAPAADDPASRKRAP